MLKEDIDRAINIHARHEEDKLLIYEYVTENNIPAENIINLVVCYGKYDIEECILDYISRNFEPLERNKAKKVAEIMRNNAHIYKNGIVFDVN